MTPYVRPENADDPTPREEFVPNPDEAPSTRTFSIYKQDVIDHEAKLASSWQLAGKLLKIY